MPPLKFRNQKYSFKPSCRQEQRSVIGKFAGVVMVTISSLGCSSNGSTAAASCSTPGGPVIGAADSHCGDAATTVMPNICTTAADEPPMDMNDAGMGDTEYGDTLYNAEGDDDDCKYRVAWTSSSICENANVTFNLKLTAKSNGAPASVAEPEIEAFLTEIHPGRVSRQNSREVSAGSYSIGPIQFDAPGQWTVRFHLFPTSCDLPASPHGHAAFYVNVP